MALPVGFTWQAMHEAPLEMEKRGKANIISQLMKNRKLQINFTILII